MLDEVEAVARERGLLLQLPALEDEKWPDHNEEINALDCTYADDTKFLGTHGDAGEVVAKAKELGSIIVAVYSKYALQLNPKTDKTEFMMKLRGREAKNEMKKLILVDEAVIRVMAADKVLDIAVVGAYQHMGAMISSERIMRPEMSRRVAQMNAHFRPARAGLYAQPRLSHKAREQFAETYCFSRLLLHAGVWDDLRSSELKSLRGSYMKVQRALAGKQTTKDSREKWTDQQVLVDRQALSIEQRLAQLRVKFFGRFAAKATLPVVRLALLARDAPRSWLSSIIDVLHKAWLSSTTLESEFPDPRSSIEYWYCKFKTDGKSVVNKCARLAVLALCPLKQKSAEEIERPIDGQAPCYVCNRVFDSRVAMLAHAKTKHGYRNPCQLRVCTTYCVCCGLEFHNRDRVLNHLRRNGGVNRCYVHYVDQVPELHPDELAEIEQAEQLRRKSGKRSRVKLLLPPAVRIFDA